MRRRDATKRGTRGQRLSRRGQLQLLAFLHPYVLLGIVAFVLVVLFGWVWFIGAINIAPFLGLLITAAGLVVIARFKDKYSRGIALVLIILGILVAGGTFGELAVGGIP